MVLDCRPSKIRRMIHAGELESVWVRGEYRVAIATLERFLVEAAKRATKKARRE
jgi:excisionase family DNA binding protein